MGDSQRLKDEGNSHFKSGKYLMALKCYSSALGLEKDAITASEKAVLYKNRAAVHLKLNDNQATVDDCTASLELVEKDPKALFRRCQAYENLGMMEEAYLDICMLRKVDPSNKEAAPIYRRLHPIMQQKTETKMEAEVEQLRSALSDGDIKAAVVLLKPLAMNKERLKHLGKSFKVNRETWFKFVSACEEAGCIDWAIVLTPVHLMGEETWLEEDTILKCRQPPALRYLLYDAMIAGHVGTIEKLLDKTDFHKTAWITNVLEESTGGAKNRLELVKLWIKAGVSTYEKQIPKGASFSFPVFQELRSKDSTIDSLKVVSLLIRSGAVPYWMIQNIFHVFKGVPRIARKGWVQETTVMLLEHAAKHVDSLVHQARLKVSHLISCRPGRQVRIEALPVPKYLKDLLNFEDVLSAKYLGGLKEEMEVRGYESDEDSDYAWTDSD